MYAPCVSSSAVCEEAGSSKHDPWMPNAVLVGEVVPVCSPWHRKWHEQAITEEQKPKRTEMPTTIADLSARAAAAARRQ